MRAILGDDALPAMRDFGEGIVPADPLPHAASLRSGAAQRVRRRVRDVDAIEVGTHFGAEPAVGDGMIRIGLEGDRPAVLDGGDHGAGIRAVMRARAVNLLQDG